MIQLFVAIVLLWILPGFALLAVFFPRREQMSLFARVAFTIPASIIISSLVGLALARGHFLTPLWIVVSVLFVTIALFVVAWLRGYRIHVTSDWKKRKKFLAVWPLIVVLLFGCTLSFSAVFHNPLPPAFSSIGYLYQAEQIVEAQGLPEGIEEYNELQVFIINKILFNLFTAEFRLVSGLDPLILGRISTILSFLGTMLAAASFFELFFGYYVSSILLSILFFVPVLKLSLLNKVFAFRGESIAYPAMFFLFWLGWRGFYLEERKKRWFALALLPVVNLLHGVTGLISALFLMSVSLAGVILKRNKWKNNLVWFVLIPLVFFFGSQFLMQATGKTLPYTETLKGAEYHPVQGEDPTWLFLKFVSDTKEVRQIQLTGFYGDIGSSLRKLAQNFSLMKSLGPTQIDIFVLIGSIGILIFLYIRPPLKLQIVRYSLLTWVLFSMAIATLALFFLWYYSTYIPAEHFFRREVKFIGFTPLFMWGFLLMWARKRLFQTTNTRHRIVGLCLGLCFLLAGIVITPEFVASTLSPDGVLHSGTITRIHIFRLLAIIIGTHVGNYSIAIFLKRPYILFLCLGLCFLLAGIVITPEFVASTLSPDGIIESKTIIRIQFFRLLTIIIGILNGSYGILIFLKIEKVLKYLNDKNIILWIAKVMVIVLIVVFGITYHVYWFSRSGLTHDGLDALTWLQGRVPPPETVLTNQRTPCSIGLISKAAGVLDGRAPYLQPDVLYDVLDKIILSQQFFISGEDNGILDQEKVRYVVVAPAGELGGNDITQGRYNVEALSRNKRLRMRKVFGDIIVYEVLRPEFNRRRPTIE
jgi:hypothetical protein